MLTLQEYAEKNRKRTIRWQGLAIQLWDEPEKLVNQMLIEVQAIFGKFEDESRMRYAIKIKTAIKMAKTPNDFVTAFENDMLKA